MFYTNVQSLGNYIALRGIDERGESIRRKIHYEPTLYVTAQKQSQWKTLDGKMVSPVKWGSMKDTRQAMREYPGDVFGIEGFQYSFISDNYPGLVDYELSKIRVAFIDIECSSEYGFPDIRRANEEVLAISIKIGDDFKVYGCGEYNPSPGVRYINCPHEEQLLKTFIDD